MSTKVWVFAVPFLLTIVCLFVFINVSDYSEPCSSLNNECFCELNPNPNSLLHQPVNTNTCIFYMLAGYGSAIYIYFCVNDYPRESTIDLILIPTFTIFVGLMSMFYHAYTTSWSSKMDGFGMYLYGSYMIGIFISRMTFNIYFFAGFGDVKHLVSKLLAVKYLVFLLLLLQFMILDFLALDNVREIVFGVWICIGLSIEFVNYILLVCKRENSLIIYQKTTFVISMVCLLLGFIFYFVETSICVPTSFFQAHGMWHWLTAMSFYFLDEYVFCSQQYYITCFLKSKSKKTTETTYVEIEFLGVNLKV